jgi:hypothetical protein
MSNEHAVLGARRAYATAALLVGISCFVQLLGIERAILAIGFAWLALKATPEPRLDVGRGRAKAGLVLGILAVVAVAVFAILYTDRIRGAVEALGG